MHSFRPALLTDHYELTMVGAALRDGTAERPCVFEVFSRRLPSGRRYGVVAGTGRLIELIRDFRFHADEIAFLRRTGVVDERAAAWLRDYRFTGDIEGYAEWLRGNINLWHRKSFSDFKYMGKQLSPQRTLMVSIFTLFVTAIMVVIILAVTVW